MAFNAVTGMDDSATVSTGNDFLTVLDQTPVVPDTSNLDLPGQFVSIPGGDVSSGGFLTSDPAGMNVLYPNPSVNPNPTGGYMQTASQILSLAQQGMKTFASGSTSPAIPAARKPMSLSGPFVNPVTGATNWTMVGGVIAVGIVGLIALAYWV
jgi:hypothetical protein